MNKPLSIILILCLALSSLGAVDLMRPQVNLVSTPNGAQVSFDLTHVSLDQWRELLTDPNRFHEYGYGVAGQPGDAALPMLTQLIPLLTMDNLQVAELERHEIALNGTLLKASPEGHLDSEPVAPLIQNYDWSRSGRSQEETVSVGEPVHLKGNMYLPVTYRPIRLLQNDSQLKISRELILEISGVTLNPRISLNEDGSIRNDRYLEDAYAPRGRYLIITPGTFQNYIVFLADWKRQIGYEVDIVTTSVAGSSASSIKNYIQSRWDVADTRPDFLLLIGDEDQGIPGHYVQNPEGTNLVTDHPYGLMEGDDSFPEIMVGRLSVDTSSELATFMAKIIAYEKTPYKDVTSWFRRALMISTNTGAASAQATKEWVADKFLENGYTQVYTAYHPYQHTTNYISSPINQGVGFVNYRGFGMYNGWVGPNFSSSDVYGTINNGAKTPVITSVVCGGGNFAAWEDPCFGEVWTRLGTSSVPRGAVAFFGPSELYTHTQFNNVIDIGIYSGIFDQGITTLGEALWNGKYELWRNYHQNSYFPFGQTPEFYHHIYNLLGDPGMQLWTDVPSVLSVSHPATRTTGDNTFFTHIQDQAGEAVADAYVALHNGELSIGGYTDMDGNIRLPFEVSSTGNIQLTITGKNLYPYQAEIPITDNEHPVLLQHWGLVDDAPLTPGATHSMRLELYGAALDLNDVTLSFSSGTPGVTLSESVVLAEVPENEVTVVEVATITTNSNLSQGDLVNVTLSIMVDGNLWTQGGQFMVQSPVLAIDDIQLLAGEITAGDSVSLILDIRNMGGLPSGPITLTPLANELVSVPVQTVQCAAIDLDGAVQSSDPVTLMISDQVFPGELLTLSFECLQNGVVDTLHYEVSAGELSAFGPSRADDYGYRMFDNQDLSYTKAQIYDWIEIDPAYGGSGSTLPLNDYYEEADASTTILLPFPVTYYGETYNQITVCTNGWAAFGERDVVDFHNRTIPSPIGPSAMLAPYWDDLITNVGYILQAHDEDEGLFILEWKNVRHLDHNNHLSFQIILFDTESHPTLTGDNDIKFQYQRYSSQDIAANFNTVGIESPDNEAGVLITYNGVLNPSLSALGPEVALVFSTDRGERLPAAMGTISQTQLSFTQNPWSTARDSIVITNVGESPLVYEFSIDTEPLALQFTSQDVLDPNLSKTSPDAPPRVTALREGSDAYGYTWENNLEDEGAAYTWIDIESPENVLDYQGDPDDGSSGPIEIGFEFPFYDDVYTSMYVGYNGTISFESSDSPWNNTFLPHTGSPPALLAPWWEDMNSDNGPFGTLYFWTNEYDQCIITYKDFPKWGTEETYTFQVILEPFGKIVFQYQTIEGPISSSTIGIQNSLRNMGLQIRYNELTPMEDETAITIRRPIEWFMASGWSGLLNGGEQAAFLVDIQTQNLDPGHYDIPITLSTSADNLQTTQILVSLDLILGQMPPGDTNQDYRIDISDLMKMLDFILLIDDMNEDQFNLADISADNAVDVIDAILLIEEILNTD